MLALDSQLTGATKLQCEKQTPISKLKVAFKKLLLLLFIQSQTQTRWPRSELLRTTIGAQLAGHLQRYPASQGWAYSFDLLRL